MMKCGGLANGSLWSCQTSKIYQGGSCQKCTWGESKHVPEESGQYISFGISSITVTVLNDDLPGTLAFETDEVLTNECTTVNVGVYCSRGCSGIITCQYDTNDGSAFATDDYELKSGARTFQHDETHLFRAFWSVYHSVHHFHFPNFYTAIEDEGMELHLKARWNSIYSAMLSLCSAVSGGSGWEAIVRSLRNFDCGLYYYYYYCFLTFFLRHRMFVEATLESAKKSCASR